MERPLTGIGILIVRENETLLGKRRGSHGEGQYACPGGHMEIDESVPEAVRRELDEEVGSQLKIGRVAFLCYTNLRLYKPKHYSDIGVVAEWQAGVPKVMEPHKVESWDWYPLDDLPSPLFGAFDNYIRALRNPELRYFEDHEAQETWIP
jgi:8-oxo-dGTP diphosphatase